MCLMENKTHPEQSYRACQGVLGYERKVGRERLINACKRAIEYDNYSYHAIKSIPLDSHNRSALMKIIEDRHTKASMIITSQLPVNAWHEVIGEKTIADAILDRIVHDANRIELIGESMRKIRVKQKEIEILN